MDSPALRKSALPVVAEEVGELVGGILEHFDAWQVDDTEVIRLVPVEAAAARDENALVMQQIEGELLVVMYVELLDINLREDIERGLGLTAVMPGMEFNAS